MAASEQYRADLYGDFFVSVVNDEGDVRLLSGPYRDDYQHAQSDIEEVRRIVAGIDPKSTTYHYGVTRLDYNATGRKPATTFNRKLFFENSYRP